MKCCLLIGLMLASLLRGYGQNAAYQVDNSILKLHDSVSVSTDAIATYLNQHFSDESDKLRAAYTWVVHNIAYDTDSMYAVNWNMGGSLKVTEAFRRKKGVCENFAGIFVDIITKAGITGVIIEGYTKQGNLINKTGHTWCAAKVKETWFLFDPTWDKDRLTDYNYFMSSPAAFASSHMPFDPLWQLTENPISHREFQGKGGGRAIPIPNFGDSIKAFMRLSELAKLEATSKRIDNSDKVSELIKNRSAFLRMQIATIYEEQDMHLYNGAVSDLNTATQLYNKYILRLNAAGPAADLTSDYRQILLPAEVLLNNARKKIADIGKFMPNFQYDPGGLAVRLQEISDKIQARKTEAKNKL